jgi:hypothetical protein
VSRAPTRPPMSKQKWRRRKVPRWLVRCAPHQAIGSLIPPDVCFGAGCPTEDLISRRLFSPCCGGPRVRIHLPPAESPSLAGLYLRASRVRHSARVCRAAFPTRSAERRRARQHRANLRQYLCRAIFQYRISGDAVATTCWVKSKSQGGFPTEGRASSGLGDAGGSCEFGMRLKRSRAQPADRARRAADVSAEAASPPSDGAAVALRGSLG